MPTLELLKLNLGCHDRVVPGFKGMDIDHYPGVDYVGDVGNLSRFKDGEVSEILASHILEHFPHTKTLDVLKEWRRVLKSGGILYVSVPDFKQMVKLYHSHGLEDWIQNMICGDQVYATAYHYAIFDEARLSGLLLAAGFSEASRVETFGISEDDCSNNRDNAGGELASLNMVAVA